MPLLLPQHQPDGSSKPPKAHITSSPWPLLGQQSCPSATMLLPAQSRPMCILFAWAWKVSIPGSCVKTKKLGAGANKRCRQRKARRNAGGGKRCGATPPGNTCCKQPPHHHLPQSPGEVPSHLGSGGEGISLTSLLKVFWPSIRSPLPLPEFLSSAMSGDLSSLDELLNSETSDLPMVPSAPVGYLVHFLSLEITCYFRRSFPILKLATSRVLCLLL